MVTHWESSTRPLFVKTIWRDGQHHVLLKKEEDAVTRRNINSSFSQGSARSTRSSKATSSNNKKVSSASVKLLLSGVGAFNSIEQKFMRCKTSVRPLETIPDWARSKESATLKRVINTSPEFKANRNLNLSIKSNSVDINVERETCDKVGTVSSYLTYNKYIEPSNNSLSERVMVWLDLATQNGNCVKGDKIQPQRIVTSCHISQKRHHTAMKRRSLVNYKLNTSCDLNENPFKVQGTSQYLQSLNPSVSLHSSVDDENFILEDTSTPPVRHHLSSEIEENIVVKDLGQAFSRNQKHSVKRQLHIFIPNLSKKYNDCDSSILSSKISTGSLQRSILSNKVLV